MQSKIYSIINLMRLNSPTGFLLLFWPSAFALSLYKPKNYIFLTLIFFLGSIVMRSAGCVINDVLDKNFDGKVARTKHRPLANNELYVFDAAVSLITLLVLAFILLINLSLYTVIACIFILPFVFLYPLAKRYTYFPQLVLGLIFNYPILVVSIEIFGEVIISAWVLYFGSIFWTLNYDTMYGFSDIQDDKKLRLKSLPILIEKFYPNIFLAIFALIFSIMIYISKHYYSVENRDLFLLFWFSITSITLYIALNIDLKNPKECILGFKINQIIGLFWAVAMLT